MAKKTITKQSVNAALDRAIEAHGGRPNKFCGDLDITRQAMLIWRENGEVPPRQAKAVELVSMGVGKREEVNTVFL